MAWVLLDSNKIVIQKQPDEANGFIEVGENVSCGQKQQSDGSFVTPAPSAGVLLENLRNERNARLAETDHYGLSDQTMTDAMSTYRQALRDITNTYTSLDDVVWPTKP
tara:strand:+ start:572 stop:895 length:324 start_codon:yes stop_codon:yes gene_type:complete